MKVLDKGFVEVIDKLGSDLTVVNAARVSFGEEKKVFDEKDLKLVKYLAKNKHYSPFRHIMVQFHIKAPEFVMRQMFRHNVGIEATSSYATKDSAWSEISQRYTKVNEYYAPRKWRKQSLDNKQASAGNLPDKNQMALSGMFEHGMNYIFELYNKLINWGVAKEQARIVLPLNIYTEVYWTASFQAIANFIELRHKPDAQYEIMLYAKVINEIVRDLFPNIYDAWFANE